MSIIYTSQIPTLAINRKNPYTHLPKGRGCEERYFKFNETNYLGFYKEIYLDCAYIGYGDISLTERACVHCKAKAESIKMHFTLKGLASYSTGDLKEKIIFRPNEHNIIYTNLTNAKIELDKGDVELLEVNMSPLFLRNFLPSENKTFEAFQNKIRRRETSVLSKNVGLMSVGMSQIIREIIHCTRKGVFKRLFLKTKVNELLLLQLEQLSKNILPESEIKQTDIDKMYVVKNYLIDHLHEHTTLAELARKVGTNEYTLKSGFKKLFGVTVYSFWLDRKMEAAKRMLLENNMLVKEVSDMVGYRHPQHFTVAFKRKYGFLPSELNKEGV